MWRVGSHARVTIWYGQDTFHGHVQTEAIAHRIVDAMNNIGPLRARVAELEAICSVPLVDDLGNSPIESSGSEPASKETGPFVVVQNPRPNEACTDCGQPMLPPGEVKRPNEYDHARGCPREWPGVDWMAVATLAQSKVAGLREVLLEVIEDDETLEQAKVRCQAALDKTPRTEIP